MKANENCTSFSISWSFQDQGEGKARLSYKKHTCGSDAPFAMLRVTVPSKVRMADRDVSLNMTWSEWALLLRGKKNLVKQI